MTTTIDIFKHVDEYDSFAAGESIFQEGEAAAFMYVVLEGEVEIYVHGKYITTIGEGGLVGEMGLIDHQPRSATVVAKTDCKLVRVDEQRFKFLVQQTPFFALHVMRILVEKLRDATEIGVNYL